MITLTITSENDDPFTVRFQSKRLESGSTIWVDSETIKEVGKSQRYGVDENFRLIIEPWVPQLDKSVV